MEAKAYHRDFTEEAFQHPPMYINPQTGNIIKNTSPLPKIENGSTHPLKKANHHKTFAPWYTWKPLTKVPGAIPCPS